MQKLVSNGLMFYLLMMSLSTIFRRKWSMESPLMISWWQLWDWYRIFVNKLNVRATFNVRSFDNFRTLWTCIVTIFRQVIRLWVYRTVTVCNLLIYLPWRWTWKNPQWGISVGKNHRAYQRSQRRCETN